MDDRRHGASESRIAFSLRNIFRRGGWKVERELRSHLKKYAPDLVVSKGDVRFVLELKMAPEARRDRLIPLFALAALQARKQALEVDALDHAVVAKKWSVLSVPTTFVLDRDGRPRQVNHGYASAEKLFGQIAALDRI